MVVDKSDKATARTKQQTVPIVGAATVADVTTEETKEETLTAVSAALKERAAVAVGTAVAIAVVVKMMEAHLQQK